MANERLIVVGAGNISNAWFPAIKAEGLQVRAVVDLQLSAAQNQMQKYELHDAVASDDLHKTLADIEADFVIDLTVPDAHVHVTCAAMESGFHVIGEKPMAATMQQARQMVRTSEKTNKLFMVSQSRRWDARHIAITRLLRENAIGDITALHCDFFMGCHFGGFREQMPSPLILDMAIHHFDLARMFCGLSPLNVYAEEFNPQQSWYTGDVAAHCLFTMQENVHFTYRGSWAAEGNRTGWNGDWRIQGTRGSIVYTQDANVRCEIVAGDEGFFRPVKNVDIPVQDLSASAMHGGLCQMLDYLRAGKLPETECHDNFQSLAMVFGAIESSKQGSRLQIESL